MPDRIDQDRIAQTGIFEQLYFRLTEASASGNGGLGHENTWPSGSQAACHPGSGEEIERFDPKNSHNLYSSHQSDASDPDNSSAARFARSGGRTQAAFKGH